MDYANGAIYSNAETDDQGHLVIDPSTERPKIHGDLSASTTSAETKSVTYPTDNELANRVFYAGSIDADGMEQRSDEV